MAPSAAPKAGSRFVEIRVFVADRDDRPADLTRVTGSLLVVPRSGSPTKKDFQLMTPSPAMNVPGGVEPRPLQDGHSIRIELVEAESAFQTAQGQGDGRPSVYLKADLEAELAQKGSSATVFLNFPSGKQRLEIGTLFVK